MDCAMARVAWIHSPMLDSQLGRLFRALPSAHGDRIGVWSGRAGGADRGIHLATTHTDQPNEMGARFTFGRALARNDSNRGRFSMELSMAAALPSPTRPLRRGSAESTAKLAHWVDSSLGTDRRDNSDVDLRYRR